MLQNQNLCLIILKLSSLLPNGVWWELKVTDRLLWLSKSQSWRGLKKRISTAYLVQSLMMRARYPIIAFRSSGDVRLVCKLLLCRESTEESALFIQFCFVFIVSFFFVFLFFKILFPFNVSAVTMALLWWLCRWLYG